MLFRIPWRLRQTSKHTTDEFLNVQFYFFHFGCVFQSIDLFLCSLKNNNNKTECDLGPGDSYIWHRCKGHKNVCTHSRCLSVLVRSVCWRWVGKWCGSFDISTGNEFGQSHQHFVGSIAFVDTACIQNCSRESQVSVCRDRSNRRFVYFSFRLFCLFIYLFDPIVNILRRMLVLADHFMGIIRPSISFWKYSFTIRHLFGVQRICCKMVWFSVKFTNRTNHMCRTYFSLWSISICTEWVLCIRHWNCCDIVNQRRVATTINNPPTNWARAPTILQTMTFWGMSMPIKFSNAALNVCPRPNKKWMWMPQPF